ncbi:collagen alpha-1(I) chain-like [Poecile atricapillus]|uniref:collagen alpha-1(I) chain-like n=1 Tax=Poecile atricapillus TaxID=48891 RepID=UPI00273935DA|nr:collagen alpha-1(I) chain-like [Poecile atricapillus]
MAVSPSPAAEPRLQRHCGPPVPAGQATLGVPARAVVPCCGSPARSPPPAGQSRRCCGKPRTVSPISRPAGAAARGGQNGEGEQLPRRTPPAFRLVTVAVAAGQARDFVGRMTNATGKNCSWQRSCPHPPPLYALGCPRKVSGDHGTGQGDCEVRDLGSRGHPGRRSSPGARDTGPLQPRLRARSRAEPHPSPLLPPLHPCGFKTRCSPLLSSSASFLSLGRASPPPARRDSLTLSPTLPAVIQPHGHGFQPPPPALCAGSRCCPRGPRSPQAPPRRTSAAGGNSQPAHPAHGSRGTRVGYSSLHDGVWGSLPAGRDALISLRGSEQEPPVRGRAPFGITAVREAAMAGAGMRIPAGRGGTGPFPWGTMRSVRGHRGLQREPAVPGGSAATGPTGRTAPARTGSGAGLGVSPIAGRGAEGEPRGGVAAAARAPRCSPQTKPCGGRAGHAARCAAHPGGSGRQWPRCHFPVPLPEEKGWRRPFLRALAMARAEVIQQMGRQRFSACGAARPGQRALPAWVCRAAAPGASPAGGARRQHGRGLPHGRAGAGGRNKGQRRAGGAGPHGQCRDEPRGGTPGGGSPALPPARPGQHRPGATSPRCPGCPPPRACPAVPVRRRRGAAPGPVRLAAETPARIGGSDGAAARRRPVAGGGGGGPSRRNGRARGRCAPLGGGRAGGSAAVRERRSPARTARPRAPGAAPRRARLGKARTALHGSPAEGDGPARRCAGGRRGSAAGAPGRPAGRGGQWQGVTRAQRGRAATRATRPADRPRAPGPGAVPSGARGPPPLGCPGGAQGLADSILLAPAPPPFAGPRPARLGGGKERRGRHCGAAPSHPARCPLPPPTMDVRAAAPRPRCRVGGCGERGRPGRAGARRGGAALSAPSPPPPVEMGGEGAVGGGVLVRGGRRGARPARARAR